MLTFRKLHNYFDYLNAIYHRMPVSSLVPPFVSIEVSAVCNLSCNKCPVGRERRVEDKYKFMDVGLYRKVIDEIKDDAVMVNLSYFGEPLINPRFFQYVAYAKERGLMVSFYSNGVALDDRMIAEILSHKVDSIAFSVDCLPDQYEFYSRMKNVPLERARAHLEKVIKNIELLAQKARAAGGRMRISAIRMDSPESTSEDVFNKFWSERGVTATSGGVMDWGGTVDRVEVTRKKTQDVQGKKGLCSWPYGFVIHSDGNVPLCHMDYNAHINLGDVNRQLVRDIYNGQKIKDIRENMIHCDYSGLPCEKCAYDDYFVKGRAPLAGILIFLLQNKMNCLYRFLKKVNAGAKNLLPKLNEGRYFLVREKKAMRCHY